MENEKILGQRGVDFLITVARVGMMVAFILGLLVGFTVSYVF